MTGSCYQHFNANEFRIIFNRVIQTVMLSQLTKAITHLLTSNSSLFAWVQWKTRKFYVHMVPPALCPVVLKVRITRLWIINSICWFVAGCDPKRQTKSMASLSGLENTTRKRRPRLYCEANTFVEISLFKSLCTNILVEAETQYCGEPKGGTWRYSYAFFFLELFPFSQCRNHARDFSHILRNWLTAVNNRSKKTKSRAVHFATFVQLFFSFPFHHIGVMSATDEKKDIDMEEQGGLDDEEPEITLTLQSQDNESFDVNKEICMISALIKTMWDGDKSETTIPLPNVKGSILNKVIEYMTHHHNNPPKEIEKPLKSNNMREVCLSFFIFFFV